MSGHVFVVGADLRRLSCDDVLVPTDRSLRVSPSWQPLLPGDLLSDENSDGACVGLAWDGDERVHEVPDDGPRRAWLLDTVDDGERGLPWLLDGAREALAAVARREVPHPVHGRASAAQEVLALLRRLGHRESVTGNRTDDGVPADAATEPVDDRPQEQRPG